MFGLLPRDGEPTLCHECVAGLHVCFVHVPPHCMGRYLMLQHAFMVAANETPKHGGIPVVMGSAVIPTAGRNLELSVVLSANLLVGAVHRLFGSKI